MTPDREQEIVRKLRNLSPGQIQVLEAFLDFLAARDLERILACEAAAASSRAFAELWDNPLDAEYDRM